jgi:hypothetical protein
MASTTPAWRGICGFFIPIQHGRIQSSAEGNIIPSVVDRDAHHTSDGCCTCDRAFSEPRGTLLANKLPEGANRVAAACQRWGVCDAGTADICAVDLAAGAPLSAGRGVAGWNHHRQVVREETCQACSWMKRTKLRASALVRPWRSRWAVGFLLWVD